MAKKMAWPMLGMGTMAVLGALVLAIAGGVNFGDFFSPPTSDEVRRWSS